MHVEIFRQGFVPGFSVGGRHWCSTQLCIYMVSTEHRHFSVALGQEDDIQWIIVACLYFYIDDSYIEVCKWKGLENLDLGSLSIHRKKINRSRLLEVCTAEYVLQGSALR